MIVFWVILACAVLFAAWMGVESLVQWRKARRRMTVRVVVVRVVERKAPPAWLADQVAESKRANLPGWMR